MQMHLLLREHPRALALRPNVLAEKPSAVLVFEHCQTANQAIAKLLPPSEFDDPQWKILNSCPVYGCLGLITVQGECFVSIVTDCKGLGRMHAEEVYKILSVSFYSLSSNAYDDLDATKEKLDWDDSETPTTVHPCARLSNLFSGGNFYFSPDFDLTRTVQARSSAASSSIRAFDDHFLWNKFLISGLLEFCSKLDQKKQADLDRSGFLVFAVRGYVGVEKVYMGADRYELSVISKLSCKRAGTRFNSRGIDDNGHVSNFVETETVLHSDRMCYAYIQVRGSIPVFWEQQGVQLMTHKIQISREANATQPAVRRHFNELQSRYNTVCIVNLLSKEKAESETQLGSAYMSAVQQLSTPKGTISMINFDLNAECRGSFENLSALRNDIRRYLEKFEYFALDAEENHVVFMQRGVFRTNCMDCLDRTNLVQNEISQVTLRAYFDANCSDKSQLDALMKRHSYLWANNGDSLSDIYAGTSALKSDFTRNGKGTFMSALSDVTKSAKRFYISTFQDKGRQEITDQLLGKLDGQLGVRIHDPIHESVSQMMLSRKTEYWSSRKITIFCGTYNLNGKSFCSEPLDPWLLQHFELNNAEPDIYVVGFQEIVELSPQQVMATDTDKRKVWEMQMELTLNSRKGGQSKYVPLRSNQLVGTALIIYVKDSIVEHIRNVETAVKKTGMGGMAGNKGAVAIRLEYYESSFCFLAAHFASGQSNVEDRNINYQTISQGLVFLQGRTVDSHENVIWISDLNYRVSLTNEKAREYVNSHRIDDMLREDQLIREMEQGRVFNGYKEGRITFNPTYKYDNGSNRYDTSEKQRIPSWTDRVIFKGEALKQLQYKRAELIASDHRPVFGLFEATIRILNHAEEERIQNELYQQSLSNIVVAPIPVLPKRKTRAPTPPPSRNYDVPVETLVDVSITDESETRQLPPPSSDTNQWWEDGQTLPKADKKRATVDRNPFEFPPRSDIALPRYSHIPVDSFEPKSFKYGNGYVSANSPGRPQDGQVAAAIGQWNNRQIHEQK